MHLGFISSFGSVLISNSQRYQTNSSQCEDRTDAFSHPGRTEMRLPSFFSLHIIYLSDFRGITVKPGMPPAPKTLTHKSQHVALPEVPSGLFGPIVTAPWGSYLPGCTETKRKLLYPFHLPDTGSLELLSCGLQMICYFDCNNNFFQKAAVTTRFTAPLHCMAWFGFYSDRLFYWLLNAMIARLHTQPNHKQI